MRERPIWTPAAIALAAGVLVAAAALADEAMGDETMGTGAEVCGDCHEDRVVSVNMGPHAVFEREGWELPEGVGVSCAACHGDPTTHLDEGGGEGTMFSFEKASPADVNETCLGCHSDDHARFAMGPHAEAGMSCVSCHSVHEAEPPGPPLLMAASVDADLAGATGASAACYSCHQEVFADFEYNERHRLHEGILECTSCHDPHEPATRPLLGGFKDALCTGCHTDKEGPYIFEHGSVQVEGCTACHTPHGSPNRHLLTFQNVAELCFSCHSEVPGFHVSGEPPRFDFTTQCTNCHSSIHGSNFDPFFLQ